MTKFETSVHEIEGLSDFRLGMLPPWLSERLNNMFNNGGGGSSDNELVDAHLRGKRIDYWGVARIDGEDVFLFEYNDEYVRSDLYEPARLAAMLHCGFYEVEEAMFRAGTTAFFTEHRTLVPRRKTTDTGLVVSSV